MPDRIRDSDARSTFISLRQTGALRIIVGMLDDRIDALQERMTRELRTVLLTSDEQVRAGFQALQGAIAEIAIVRDQFIAYSKDRPPPELSPEDEPDTLDLQDDV